VKKAIKITLASVGAVALCGVLWVGCGIVRSYRRYFTEEKIVATYGSVVEAIEAFTEKQGHPPSRLQDLMPRHLTAIPQIDEVHSVEYHRDKADGVWSLHVRSRATGRARVYLFRSTRTLTAAEKTRSLGYCHGFWVLQDSR
jgi:hypothetical protein